MSRPRATTELTLTPKACRDTREISLAHPTGSGEIKAEDKKSRGPLVDKLVNTVMRRGLNDYIPKYNYETVISLISLNIFVYFFVQIPLSFGEFMSKWGVPKLLVSFFTFIPKVFLQILYRLVGFSCPCEGPSPLYALAAQNSTTVQAGQYWKLITATFLHGGVFHLLSNMIALFSFGTYLEQRIGNFKFSVIYFLSALLSGFASSSFLPENIISIGASGAIYGIIAANIVLQGVERESIGRGLINAWILCDLVTEGILAFASLNSTKYDELLQLIALVVIRGILIRSFPKFQGLRANMDNTICRFLANLLFNSNIDHMAHFVGGLTGFILASTLLIASAPQLSGGDLLLKNLVEITGVKDYKLGQVIASRLEDNKVVYDVHILMRDSLKKDPGLKLIQSGKEKDLTEAEANKSLQEFLQQTQENFISKPKDPKENFLEEKCLLDNIIEEIPRENLNFINSVDKLENGAVLWPMVVLVIAIFASLCLQAYTKDLYAEELLTNTDILDGLTSRFEWLDLGVTGASNAKWIKLPQK